MKTTLLASIKSAYYPTYSMSSDPSCCLRVHVPILEQHNYKSEVKLAVEKSLQSPRHTVCIVDKRTHRRSGLWLAALLSSMLSLRISPILASLDEKERQQLAPLAILPLSPFRRSHCQLSYSFPFFPFHSLHINSPLIRSPVARNVDNGMKSTACHPSFSTTCFVVDW